MPILGPDARAGLRDSASHSLVDNALNSTSPANALQVICAWPVSSQYGAGSRVLYYVLVAACVFARKSEWLRNAVLAAALLVPAVAAIHGIVLTALHNDDAVDMDIYGAFQLCAIGVLAAPVTARMSNTYFNDPGRNTIFVWTSLLLAGLISLTVEFFRTTPISCADANVPTDPIQFPYNSTPTCGLVCNTTAGPFSILRGGSANNLYVVPAPNALTFGMATLLSAGCCIPPILSLVIMWNKILDTNWRARKGEKEPGMHEVIEGTNRATPRKMEIINRRIRAFLRVVEGSVFGGLVLAILILGEINFWSPQVMYMVEPFATVGQWSPIAGIVLGLSGSFYMLLAAQVESETTGSKSPGAVHRTGSPQNNTGAMTPNTRASMDETQDAEAPNAMNSTASPEARDADTGSRRKIAKTLKKLSELIDQAAERWNEDEEFKDANGKATNYPKIPGEETRNAKLPATKLTWKANDSDSGASQPPHRPTSRASSFVRSGLGIVEPPEIHLSPETKDNDTDSHDFAAGPSTPSPDPGMRAHDRRRDTLEVPTFKRRA